MSSAYFEELEKFKESVYNRRKLLKESIKNIFPQHLKILYQKLITYL
jgi:hypothetical protein